MLVFMLVSMGSCPLFPPPAPKSAGPGERANGLGDTGERREDRLAGPDTLVLSDAGVKAKGERLDPDLVLLPHRHVVSEPNLT